MGVLGNRVKTRVNSRKSAVEAETIIPTYQLHKKKKKIPRWALILLIIILAIFIIFYLPPMVIDEVDVTTRSSVNLRDYANTNAMEWAKTYLRNNPESDFDGDGLTNEDESNYNTGLYIPDSDNDGVTDYAELYLTNSNPTVKDDSITTFVKQSDLRTGNQVNTPFTIHNIILWADDYYSKARGSVLPLSDGSYNFFRFQGWVQFPENPVCAYKVVNGVQTPLKKNANGYFYIDSKYLTNVRIYQEQPEACYILYVLGTGYTLPENVGTKILSFILPNHGFGVFTIKPALINDVDGTYQEKAVTNKIITTSLNDFSDVRFGRNECNVTDLAKIFEYLENDSNVIISLMSQDFGESILEVYGYTTNNNLLVCDPKTGEDFGYITIKAMSERLLNQSGSIEAWERFSFEGCGYSSAAGNRISILGIMNHDGTYYLFDEVNENNVTDISVDSDVTEVGTSESDITGNATDSTTDNAVDNTTNNTTSDTINGTTDNTTNTSNTTNNDTTNTTNTSNTTVVTDTNTVTTAQ
jgi:hypothetical protein